MGGAQMRRLLRSHVIVVFGATSRIGKATIEALTGSPDGVTVVAAVERPKDPRIRRLRRATGVHIVQCDYNDVRSIQRVVRNADAVLLVPALSPSGTRFSKRVLNASVAENVNRIVLISSMLALDTSGASGHEDEQLGYEAIEAHARSITDNSVALRIPLLMETLLYCREEVVFAHRFFSCFQPHTPVPCIAVKDVARAAMEVLTKPTAKFDQVYSLANQEVTCTPTEVERMLSQALGRPIKAKYIDEDKFTQVLEDKGASELVAVNTIRMKNFIEKTDDTEQQKMPVEGRGGATSRPLTRLGYSSDYRTLTKRALTSPQQWLQQNRVYFERSADNQMQLFVMGSGEGLFQDVERLVAQQVTAPLAAATTSPEGEEMGEAAIPTSTGAALHSKATFCTIKTVPRGHHQPTPQHGRSGRSGRKGQDGGHAFNTPAEESPMMQLLSQLTPADVILFVPPFRFGAAECMDVLKVVVDSAQRSKAWGIVMVSSIFTGRGFNDSVNRMGEMEQYIEDSGVPYAIVRLPLFMEYFLALSPTMPPRELQAGASTEEEKEAEPEPLVTSERPRGGREAAPTSSSSSAMSSWPLLGRALASTPQYLISTTDAAKVLVAVAYTFPLHRNRTRTVYTERQTMREIEDVFQRHAHKGATIDFSRVDALQETPGREFWRVTYWTKNHVKQFLETAVQLSGERTPAVEMLETFGDITECHPTTLERWAAKHSKSYTHALAVSQRQRKKSVSKEQENAREDAKRNQELRSIAEERSSQMKEPPQLPEPMPTGQRTVTATS